jgi:hypothetical protein
MAIGSAVTNALDFCRPAVSNRESSASVLYTEGGMNLLDALRHAEQQGKSKVQRGAEKLHRVEDAVRRKITGRVPAPAKERTGIVSINGRDVEKMHCTGGRHTA